ncbi:ion channel [Nesterenkonia sp. LB17]|uniref:potassium channel family protein n=1 Tax=unclassified Nesterenkonia TaxID=2629769 RepID=UPI001F4C9D37|nr:MULTISPECIES: potassium channel family protein [unclassified Nesterenkonia]MCH8560146.1 ion channel [Nesterenkonia sp. DZ6]MCH8564030.1 ion channel [Nesterenkonia sp. YGD6]MCH8564141.1 ion channel [Nesterenkonia sp. LB17]
MAPEEASEPVVLGRRERSKADFGARYQRWDKATELPMAIVALAFLVVYAYLVLANTRPTDVSWPPIFLIGVWVVFALHYVISLVLVRNRGRWFVTHLHELAMAALPFLRPLQLLRLVKVVAVMHRTMGSALRGKVSVYVAGVSGMLVLVAALGVLDAEQNAEGANITSFSDALWWAFVTISSVGYGDYYPVTGLGRLIAIGLMIAGIALIGSITATIASWFVERITEAQRQVTTGQESGPGGPAGPGGGARPNPKEAEPQPGP